MGEAIRATVAYLGIDVGKRSHSACGLGEDGEVAFRSDLENRPADIDRLLERAGAGALEQPVDVGGPVLEVGPEGHLSVLAEAARAVRPLPDVDPQVGNGGPDRFAHGASSPLSRPESAEATPTLPGRGPDRARHISISRFPRAVPPRWQHPPGPLRGRGRRPSGAVGRRPSVRPNRNALKVKGRPYGRLRL